MIRKQTCYNIVYLFVTGLLQSILTKAIPTERASLLCLVTSVLCDRAGDLPNVDEIINNHKDDFRSPDLLRQELFRFQIRWNIVN